MCNLIFPPSMIGLRKLESLNIRCCNSIMDDDLEPLSGTNTSQYETEYGIFVKELFLTSFIMQMFLSIIKLIGAWGT